MSSNDSTDVEGMCENVTKGGSHLGPCKRGEKVGWEEAASSSSHRNWWALVLVLIPLVTVFGNVLVLLSVFRERGLGTITNYFICSLATADILVAVAVMPFAIYVELVGGWLLSDSLCDIWVACDVMACTASILNLTAISVDRFIAVAHPIKYAKHNNFKRVYLTLALTWLISLFVAAPLLLGINYTEQRPPGDCTFYNANFMLYSSMASFYIPLCIMIFLYCRIYYVIHQRAARSRATTTTEPPTVMSTLAGQGNNRHVTSNITTHSPTTGATLAETPLALTPAAASICSGDDENYIDNNRKFIIKDISPSLTAQRLSSPKTEPEAEPISISRAAFLGIKGAVPTSSELVTSPSSAAPSTLSATKAAGATLAETPLALPPAAAKLKDGERRGQEGVYGSIRNGERCQEWKAGTTTATSFISLSAVKIVADTAAATPLASPLVVVTFTDGDANGGGSASRRVERSQGGRRKANEAADDGVGGVGFGGSGPDPVSPFRKWSESVVKIGSSKHTIQMLKGNLSSKRKKKVTRTLVIVLGAFMFCWIPFFTVNVVNAACILYSLQQYPICKPPRLLFSFVMWLGYINSLLNPLICGTFNPEFRRGIGKILAHPLQCCREI